MPPRSNWNSISANFLHDRAPGYVRVIEKFFAKSNRHFEVHSIGIYTIFWLSNDDFLYDSACEIESGQRRINLLLYKIVPLAVQIDQPCAILQTAEAALDTPTLVVDFL